MTTEPHLPQRQGGPAVVLRRFPYPFKAMLAISTDIDQTQMEAFRETHRFMNTLESTAMGPGVGLEVSNSFWAYGRRGTDEPSLFADRNSREPAAVLAELLSYLRCGWIDTLHSYGPFNLDFTRDHARDALQTLSDAGIAVRVWVNHGGPSNNQNLIGANRGSSDAGNRTQWRGDVPGAPEYHADLLLEYGMMFTWEFGRHAHAFGHDPMLSPWELADGAKMWGFPRSSAEMSTPDAEAYAARTGLRVSGMGPRRWLQLWRPHHLPRQLDAARLDHLVTSGQPVIVAQHLGSLGGAPCFAPATADAFRLLKSYEDDGLILVARTGRLLRYEQVRNHLEVEGYDDGEHHVIDLARVTDPLFGEFVPELDDVRGITVELARPAQAIVRAGGRDVPEDQLVRVEPHGDAQGAVGVRWFRRDLTDHGAAWRR